MIQKKNKLTCVFYVSEIDHVNKEGDIVGPHVLEHIVDAIVYLQVSDTRPLLFLFF